jgi:uncharacterized protein
MAMSRTTLGVTAAIVLSMASMAFAGEGANTQRAGSSVGRTPDAPPRLAVLVRIKDIQGNSLLSPMLGNRVSAVGIVTARTADGYFIQTVPGQEDSDAATSEGLFVHTLSAPPANAAVGARVQVNGVVAEFTPADNPNQLSRTELTASTLTVIAAAEPLPAAIVLGDRDLSPAVAITWLERYEGMRVTLPYLRVWGPASAVVNESAGTATTDGIFHAIFPTMSAAQPFREPGIAITDTVAIPAGKSPPIFDGNPEVLRVSSAGQAGAVAIAADAYDILYDMPGVLDYADAAFTLLLDPGVAHARDHSNSWTLEASPAFKDEVSVASYDLFRLFDDQNDPTRTEPVLTTAAFYTRLRKHAAVICSYLHAPDVIGISQAENLSSLQRLADAINTNVAGGCGTSPAYVAYLLEGNGSDGLDVGLLVSTRAVAVGKPRIEVLSLAQSAKAAVLSSPSGVKEPLFERPPLIGRLRANDLTGGTFLLTVVANHLAAQDGINSPAPGGNGWTSVGRHVRVKRAAQAEALAQILEDRQLADPAENIVALGNFNAYEFNDGYADVMGVVTGHEAAEASVLEYVESPVSRDFDDLTSRLPDYFRATVSQRGSAAALDHILVSANVATNNAPRMGRAMVNADFGADLIGDGSLPMRASDHDPLVALLNVKAFRSADLVAYVAFESGNSLDVTHDVSPARLSLFFGNYGPTQADDLAYDFDIGAPQAFLTTEAVAPPDYLTCTTTPINGGQATRFHCVASQLGASTTLEIRVLITPNASFDGRRVTVSAAVASSTHDPEPGNNVGAGAITFTSGTSLHALGGMDLMLNPLSSGTMIASIRNDGPRQATGVTMDLVIDAPANRFSTAFENNPDWMCTPTQDTPTSSRIHCVLGYAMPVSSYTADLRFHVVPYPSDIGRVLHLRAIAAHDDTDIAPADDATIFNLTINPASDLRVTATATAGPVSLSSGGRYDVTLQTLVNGAGHVVLTMIVNAPVSTLSLLPPPANWTCDAPLASGPSSTTFTCRVVDSFPGPASFTIVHSPRPHASGTETIALVATAASAGAEQSPADNSASAALVVDSTTDFIVSTVSQQGQVAEPREAIFTVAVSSSGRNLPRDPTLRIDFNRVIGPSQFRFFANGGSTATPCTIAATAAGAMASYLCPTGVNGVHQVKVDTRPEMVGGTMALTATVANSLFDTALANNASAAQTPVVSVADLCLSIGSFDCGIVSQNPLPFRVLPGGIGHFGVDLRNLGPSTAINARVVIRTSVAPARLSAHGVGASCSPAVAQGAGSEVTCSLGALIAATASDRSIEFDADATGLAAGTSVSYDVSAMSDSADPVAANHRVTGAVPIAQIVDLSARAFGPKSGLAYGLAGDFIIQGEAVGPDTTAVSTMTIDIVADLASAPPITAPGWVCGYLQLSAPNYRARCTRSMPLAAGETGTLRFRVTPTFAMVGKTMRVTATHDYLPIAVAIDNTAANNSQTLLVTVKGRSTVAARAAPLAPPEAQVAAPQPRQPDARARRREDLR